MKTNKRLTPNQLKQRKHDIMIVQLVLCVSATIVMGILVIIGLLTGATETCKTIILVVFAVYAMIYLFILGLDLISGWSEDEYDEF